MNSNAYRRFRSGLPQMAAGLVVAALGFLLFAGPAAADEPEITESNVENGDVLNSPPEVLHLCFSEPVNTEDAPGIGEGQADELPWAFSVEQPDGTALGLRIVFVTDGGCVDVYPGIPPDPPEGTWMFDWMVRSQSTGDPASGVITFQVGDSPPQDQGGGSNDDGDGIGTPLIIGIAVGIGAALVVTAFVAMFSRRTKSTRD